MADSSLRVIIFILVFWLFLPIPFILYNTYATDSFNFNTIDTSNLESIKNPTIFDNLGVMWSVIGIYFQMVFLWINGLPLILNYFLILLRIISAFVIVMVGVHGF
jgi:hypothetical protein